MQIYLVSLGFDSVYKIGATRKIEKRMKSLARGNPWLELITFADLGDVTWEECVEVEKGLFRIFEPYRWSHDNGTGNKSQELFQFNDETLHKAIVCVNARGETQRLGVTD